ncbi:class I adenylate-forming enzyme family protein [Mariniluteicoccus flavus]
MAPDHLNLAEAIRRHATERPDAVALVERGEARRQVTWAEFDAMVDESAAAYAALGLRAGQRLGVVMTNTIEGAVAWFAGLRGGVVIVPVNPGLTDPEIARALAHAGAGAALCDDDRPLGDGVRRVVLHGHRDLAGPTRVESVPDPESLAAIVYTSGSQGEPRGAMLTQRALLAYCDAAAEAGVSTPDSIALGMLPLFHAYGLNAVLGSAVHAGATTVLVEGMPDDICQQIFDERISHLPVTPSVLYRLVQDDGLTAAAGSLRLVSSGAAPMPAVLGERFTQLTGRRVEQGYGLTEASPGVTTTVGHELRGPGHVGRPLPCVEVRTAGGERSEPGALSVRGANLFSGYWPDGAGGPDAEGWFPTGDIGYLHGDDLFLVDREREIVIVSGFNVFPSEVEEVLEQHDSVDAAAVIGQPDEHTGERVVAFVQGKKVQLAGVRAHARAHLARYKVPSEFVVLKSLPRTPTGKVRKGALRDMLDRVEEES